MSFFFLLTHVYFEVSGPYWCNHSSEQTSTVDTSRFFYTFIVAWVRYFPFCLMGIDFLLNWIPFPSFFPFFSFILSSPSPLCFGLCRLWLDYCICMYFCAGVRLCVSVQLCIQSNLLTIIEDIIFVSKFIFFF